MKIEERQYRYNLQKEGDRIQEGKWLDYKDIRNSGDVYILRNNGVDEGIIE